MSEATKLALAALEELKGTVTYAHRDDECGAFVCCGEVSYKGHAKDCYLMTALNALREEEATLT